MNEQPQTGPRVVFNRGAAREVKTYADDSGNAIVARRRIVPGPAAQWLFSGSCPMRDGDGNQRRFEFPIQAATLEEAMAVFGEQAEARFAEALRKHRAQQIRQEIMTPGPVPVSRG